MLGGQPCRFPPQCRLRRPCSAPAAAAAPASLALKTGSDSMLNARVESPSFSAFPQFFGVPDLDFPERLSRASSTFCPPRNAFGTHRCHDFRRLARLDTGRAARAPMARTAVPMVRRWATSTQPGVQQRFAAGSAPAVRLHFLQHLHAECLPAGNAFGTPLERLSRRLGRACMDCRQRRPSPTCRWERLLPLPLPWSRLQAARGPGTA